MVNQKFNNLLKDPRTKWKFIWIVVILAVIVGAGILGYYYWWIADLEARVGEIEMRLPGKIVQVPPKEVIEEEIADWRMYENKLFSYSFRYPSSWKIDDHNLHRVAVESNTNDIVVFEASDYPFDIGFCYGLEVKTEQTILSGYPGTKFTCYKENNQPQQIILLFDNINSRSYIVSGYSSDKLSIVEQIISTFKFIE